MLLSHMQIFRLMHSNKLVEYGPFFPPVQVFQHLLSYVTYVCLVILQLPYRAVAQALEVIPRTLAQNCGVNVIRTMTALQAKVSTL
jgi:hypothetical protein